MAKLKRILLALNNWPRLDFVVHILATETVPSYQVIITSVNCQFWSSWTHALMSDQKALQKAWLHLRSRTIKGQYDTDPAQWTCSCGAQNYHAHLLCKHLVASVDIPSENWWPLSLRSHTALFYFVPGTSSESLDSHDNSQYHWLSRMPGELPTLFQMPQRALASSNVVSNFVSSLFRPPSDGDDSLTNGILTGFKCFYLD